MSYCLCWHLRHVLLIGTKRSLKAVRLNTSCADDALRCVRCGISRSLSCASISCKKWGKLSWIRTFVSSGNGLRWLVRTQTDVCTQLSIWGSLVHEKKLFWLRLFLWKHNELKLNQKCQHHSWANWSRQDNKRHDVVWNYTTVCQFCDSDNRAGDAARFPPVFPRGSWKFSPRRAAASSPAIFPGSPSLSPGPAPGGKTSGTCKIKFRLRACFYGPIVHNGKLSYLCTGFTSILDNTQSGADGLLPSSLLGTSRPMHNNMVSQATGAPKGQASPTKRAVICDPIYYNISSDFQTNTVIDNWAFPSFQAWIICDKAEVPDMASPLIWPPVTKCFSF